MTIPRWIPMTVAGAALAALAACAQGTAPHDGDNIYGIDQQKPVADGVETEVERR